MSGLLLSGWAAAEDGDAAVPRAFAGQFIEVTSTSAATAAIGNYVVFRNVTADSVTLRIDNVSGVHFTPGVIAGVQVLGQSLPIDRIESPTPSSAATRRPERRPSS